MMEPPRVPATRPPKTPTRMAASKPRSAHWKFFTRKRKYTPRANGMHVKRTKRMLRSRDRRLAKSSFLNSCERPSALATAVATPNLSRSCMSRYSRSTRLFLHRSGAVRTPFAGAALPSGAKKALHRESADVHRGGTASNQVGHDLGGDWGQKDAVTKMAGGDKNTGGIGWPNDGQVVGCAGTESRPAVSDWCGHELRQIFFGGVE